MQKNIIWIGIIVVAFISLVWVARPGSGSPSSVSVPAQEGLLLAEPAGYDFGPISMAAGKVSYIFRVKNTGTDPIAINKLYTSCMCTTARLIIGDRSQGPFGMQGHGGFMFKFDEKLEAGEEAQIEVVFDPAAHGPAGVGKIERVVLVENDEARLLSLKISAEVTP